MCANYRHDLIHVDIAVVEIAAKDTKAVKAVAVTATVVSSHSPPNCFFIRTLFPYDSVNIEYNAA
jgi:hypothetical protein